MKIESAMIGEMLTSSITGTLILITHRVLKSHLIVHRFVRSYPGKAIEYYQEAD